MKHQAEVCVTVGNEQGNGSKEVRGMSVEFFEGFVEVKGEAGELVERVEVRDIVRVTGNFYL